MEEGGRRLEMKISEAGKVFVSELVVNSDGLEMWRVSSVMGRVRQSAKMGRSKQKRIILALLQRICDPEFWICGEVKYISSTFNQGFVQMFAHFFRLFLDARTHTRAPCVPCNTLEERR